jgi:hypothetical protein
MSFSSNSFHCVKIFKIPITLTHAKKETKVMEEGSFFLFPKKKMEEAIKLD